MKIRSLCVVKNEADVIEQTLRAAAKWCDTIYVLDNGSDDRTWDIVKELSKELTQVEPFESLDIPFEDSIRDIVLSNFSIFAEDDDWWCILDADEFYIDNPREFLEEVPLSDRSVWMLLYTYLFTDKDLERYNSDRSSFEHLTIEERLRYYVINDYTDLRFFRHRKGIRSVPMTSALPAYDKLIRVKHFAYRSPQQIAYRLRTRAEPMLRGEFIHEKRSNWLPGGSAAGGPAMPADLPCSWMERVTSHEGCHFDRLDGVYAEGVPLNWPPKPPMRGFRNSAVAYGLKLLERRRHAVKFAAWLRPSIRTELLP